MPITHGLIETKYIDYIIHGSENTPLELAKEEDVFLDLSSYTINSENKSQGIFIYLGGDAGTTTITYISSATAGQILTLRLAASSARTVQIRNYTENPENIHLKSAQNYNLSNGQITLIYDGSKWNDIAIEDGYQGSQGSQGFQGTTGLQGTAGSQGDQGSQGTTGLQGTAGSQGDQGSQGTTGLQGTAGSQGDQGLQGLQGLQGTAGSQGNQGLQGAAGLQGTAGSQGDQGSQGTTGLQGTAGSQGFQGERGFQGYLGSYLQRVTGTFTSASLASNILTINHNLNLSSLVIQIYDDENYLVIPTEATYPSNNTIEVDFTGITGIAEDKIWSYIIVYSISDNVFVESLIFSLIFGDGTDFEVYIKNSIPEIILDF
jgi:hypothetical protein